jgi:hypothetical protein
MYGTIARLRLKPGMGAQAAAYMQERYEDTIPGSRGSYIYQMDADADELYLVVMFDSKESYMANANSPEQNTRYEEMLGFLAGPPEWHDGEIIYSQTPGT